MKNTEQSEWINNQWTKNQYIKQLFINVKTKGCKAPKLRDPKSFFFKTGIVVREFLGGIYASDCEIFHTVIRGIKVIGHSFVFFSSYVW